ncbi:hypothetical protein [Bacillus sp. H1a]|uniref:hypothetical protein n=1 Tax=Bacillus sp. H1a TaxID=1397276 RepID=UPI000468BD6E|nr:hypothetical protein [Bacillus sp. H1a]
MTTNINLEKMQYHLDRCRPLVELLFDSINGGLYAAEDALKKISELEARKEKGESDSTLLPEISALLNNEIAKSVYLTDYVQDTCGYILDQAKQGLGYTFGKAGSWPTSLKKNDVPISLIIRGGRNQSIHWSEFKFNDPQDPNDRGKIRKAFKEMYDNAPLSKKQYFDLTNDDPDVSNPKNRNRANHVVRFLEWNSYSDFENTLLSFVR